MAYDSEIEKTLKTVPNKHGILSEMALIFWYPKFAGLTMIDN